MAQYYIPLVGTPQIGDNSGGGGSGGGVLVVNISYDESTSNYVCDKTAGEMAAALESGGIIFRVTYDGEYSYITLTGASVGSGGYVFKTSDDEFRASSPNDYPASGGIQ